MYRTAYISAYDVMDEVWVHAQCSTRGEDPESTATRTMTASVQVKGVGEPEDRRWLRDALVALAETL